MEAGENSSKNNVSRLGKYLPVIGWIGGIVGTCLAAYYGAYISDRFGSEEWRREFYKQERAKRCSEKLVLYKDLVELNGRVYFVIARSRQMMVQNLIRQYMYGMGLKLGKTYTSSESEDMSKNNMEAINAEKETVDIEIKAGTTAIMAGIYFGDEAENAVVSASTDLTSFVMKYRLDDNALEGDFKKAIGNNTDVEQQSRAVASVFEKWAYVPPINAFGNALSVMEKDAKNCARSVENSIDIIH